MKSVRRTPTSEASVGDLGKSDVSESASCLDFKAVPTMEIVGRLYIKINVTMKA
jgi:hypothetical protein